MSVVVFLGPSLERPRAESILSAVYLPPARQADLLSAVTTYRPDAIGLVDGVFGHSLSVWHKEILFALERGIAVYGASSMGALRAVETEECGTIGVGEVYRMYREQELTDDDEVALAHGNEESGFRKLSEPLVNLRKTLERGLREGAVTKDEHDLLLRVAKSLYFPDRTQAQLLAGARAAGLGEERAAAIEALLEGSYVDVKRDDAIELLERMARRDWETAPERPAFQMTRSHLFDALFNRDRTVRHDGVDVPLESIAAYAALHMPDFEALSSAALNRTLVGILAEMLEVEVDDGELAAARLRLGRRFGLDEDREFEEWALDQRLEPEELDAMVREEALCHKLKLWLVTRRYLERTTKMVLDELRLTGRFEQSLTGAALVEKVIEANYPSIEQTDHSDMDLNTLLADHLRSTGCRIEGDLETWIELAGFKDVHGLRFELLRHRLARDVLRQAAADAAAVLGGADAG